MCFPGFHKYRVIDSTEIAHIMRKQVYKHTTEMLLICHCGKVKVKSIPGSWTLADLRKAYNE